MITAQNLTKYYGGKRALGPVSFEIADGECVGFLGLNGAGKTTALRILACDLRPSAGSVTIGTHDALRDPHSVRKHVGFLPEFPPLYTDMTVSDYLLFAGRLRGMTRAELDRRLPRVLELADITKVKDQFIFTLSHGYKQRVGLAQAIIHEPKLVILDEPTRGLDPAQIVEMRKLIRALKEKHTILVSSHVLTEIQETCDRLLVLGDGEIVGSGTEEELSAKVEAELAANKLEQNVVIIGVRPGGELYRGTGGANLDPAAEAVKRVLEGVAGVSRVDAGDIADGAQLFEVVAGDDVRAAACRAVIEAGHDVIRLDRVERQLENIFLRLVHGGGNARN